MTDDILARAREALAGVTDGPWEWTDDVRQRLVAGPGDQTDREIIRCAALLHPRPADAEFIAAARDLVPELVAEVELLRVLLGRVRDLADASAAGITWDSDEITDEITHALNKEEA